jgi:hypothetical protein
MPVDQYSSNEDFAVRMSDFDTTPLKVNYKKGRYRGDDARKTDPGGDAIIESVFIFGGRHGDFAVIKYDGKPLTPDQEEQIAKIQQINPKVLDQLKQLPHYVKKVIEI